MFQLITKTWGKILTVHAFAAHHNHQLPVYWSSQEDPFASKINAFNQNWKRNGLYLFPPWKLIPKVLWKMKQDRTKKAVLVTPLWTSQFWFPAILQMEHLSWPIMENEQQVEFNGLEIINNYRKANGMNENLIDYLNKATRSTTNKMYDTAWKKYVDWCLQHSYQPRTYDPQQVLRFLMSCNELQLSTLNGHRSALASVLNVIYPKRSPIAEVSDVSQFFNSKRRLVVSIPKETQTKTWDLDILTKQILQNLSPSQLSLYDLQQKLSLLLCMHTLWRRRSDIGRIQYRDVLLKFKDGNFEGVSIHVREPEDAQQKTSQLGILQEETCQELCW